METVYSLSDSNAKMITVTGQPGFDDYLRAQRYHGRSRALLISGILGALALLVWLTSNDPIFPAVVALYVFVVRPLYIRVHLKRRWERTPSAHGKEKTYGLDENGFHSADDEGKPCITHWDKFLKFRESKATFLLYLSPHQYIYLPKRFMNPQDQEATRTLLTEKIEQSQRNDANQEETRLEVD